MSSSNLEQLVPTKHGWHVRFDKRFDPTWKPFSRPRFRQLVEYVPLFIRFVLECEKQRNRNFSFPPARYLRIWYDLKKAQRRAHMDFINPTPLQQIYGEKILKGETNAHLSLSGVPMGGLGCGTIGRGFKGEFCRYQLVPGLYECHTVEANTVSAFSSTYSSLSITSND